MARVVIRDELRRLCGGGEEELYFDAKDIRHLIRVLDENFPGAAELLNRDGTAVAIDGVVYNAPLAEPLKPDSEVCFLPAIRGG